MTRESMSYDLLIVGAGPAGLSCAIRYAQMCQEHDKPVKACVLEKGSEVGAHILSGAVLNPKALNELLPNWQDLNPPPHTPATSDHFYFLSEQKNRQLPTPGAMKNKGNFIVSLGQICRWLAEYAESLGVEIYPGFAGSECLFENDRLIGVATPDQGVDKEGEKKASYEPGMALLGKEVVLAEGARGYLTEQIIHKYQLRKKAQPQTYAIGLKEIWEIPSQMHEAGKIIHTVGWPLDPKTYGGGFIYHWQKNLLSIGLVIGLDYENPYLDPYQCFQQFKTHPLIKPLLEKGQVLSYGARALTEGGWQSIPQLTFPGGVIAGCAAGFMNVPKIKGTHTAMKSGMLAAEFTFKSIHKQKTQDFTQQVKKSWIGKELKKVRNIRPGFHKGLKRGLFYAAIDTYVFRGYAPWTLKHLSDHKSLKKAQSFKPIDYPKPDGKITFDKMTSVARSNVFHEEDQPSHLKLKDPNLALKVNLNIYAGPEAYYCPAGVYEYIESNGQKVFQINAQNCIHCKTCDIKDPKQNIQWTPPSGGGPNYGNM